MKSKLLSLIALASLWGSLAHAELLPAGALDPTFGADKNGLVRTARPNEADVANASVIQLDGKIIVVGTSQVNGADKNFFLTRYNSDGTTDTTFGTQGFVTKDMSGHPLVGNTGGDDEATAVALEGNQIVVAGYVSNGNDKDIVLARFNADGSLDSTFASGQEISLYDNDEDIASAIAIQPNQKIIVVGRDIRSDTHEHTSIIHYDLEGIRQNNNNFSITLNNEKITTPYAVQIQSDGKILIAGAVGDLPLLTRWNENLIPDTSFGPAGDPTRIILPIRGEFRSIIFQNGKILAGGFTEVDGSNDFMMIRCENENCSALDSTFGNQTLVTTNILEVQGVKSSDIISSLTLQNDGKIIAAGVNINGLPQPFIASTIVRYDTQGNIDTSFNGNGIAITRSGTEPISTAKSALVQSDGKILVIGSAGVDENHLSITLARYLEKSFDTSINSPSESNGGCSITSLGSFNLFAFALWLIPIGLFGWRRMRK